MTKAIKLTLVIAAAMVLAGMIIAGIGIAIGGLNRSERYEEFTVTYPADISEIKTDLGIAHLAVTRTAGSEITVHYYDNENKYYSISKLNNELSINRGNRKWINFVGFNFISYENDIDIGIPEDFTGVLTLKTSTGQIKILGLTLAAESSAAATTGSITIENCNAAGNFKASASTGKVKLDSFNVAGNLNVDTSTGSINFDSVNVAGNLSVTESTGNMNGSGINCGGNIYISRSSGSLLLDKVKAASIRTEASTGTTRITNLSTSGSIYLESSTGDINCSVTDTIKNYNITSKTTTGHNGLPAYSAYGDKQLNVFTTTGSIRFTFEE